MDETPEKQAFKFKPTQFLGTPRIMAPPKNGHKSAALLFVIPGLHIGVREQPPFLAIAKACGLDVFEAALELGKSQPGDQDYTLVSIAFYVPEEPSDEETSRNVNDIGRLLLERFMGSLSFLAGMRFSAVAAQTTVARGDGKFATRLEAQSRVGGERYKFTLPEVPFGGRVPSEELFSAMFWLRRGLAERDPLETYGALMVALQSLARELVQLEPTEITCPNCGHVQETRDPSVTALVRELVVTRMGRPKDLFSRLWRARNAITAHGNRTVTADVFLELIELKYEAIKLCFDAIKLALGLPAESQPHPHQALFVSSAMMYVD